MNIFKKRPLSLILCIMLGGFSLFANIGNEFKMILLSVSVLLLIFTLIFKLNIISLAAPLKVCLICLILSMLASECYFFFYFPREYTGKEVDVTGLVTEIDESNSSYTVLTIDATDINGNGCSHKLYSSISSDEYGYIKVGDTVKISATLYSFDESSDYYDGSYYVGKGYSARLTKITDIEILSSGRFVLGNFFSVIRKNLTDRMIDCTSFEAAGLLSALLIGERTLLSDYINLNFKRIGITHILSLSGMHLAILTAAVSGLLSLFGIKKRPKAVIVAVFDLGYMLLTGMSSSVMRAGLMVIISSVLYILSRSSDAFTLLSCSVMIIVLIEPYAVFDLSLWLSAFATFGLVCFSEYRAKRKPRKRSKTVRILLGISDAFMSSVFAIGATLVFTATKFTTISILTPVTTLIFSPFIELFIHIGTIMLIFGNALPLGIPVTYFYNFIKHLSEIFSDVRWATAYSLHPAVQILIFAFSVLFFLFIVLNIKRKKIMLGIILTLFFLVFATAAMISQLVLIKDNIIYYESEKSDVILMIDEHRASAVYSGELSEFDGKSLCSSIYGSGITYVDNLVLSNYSGGISEFVKSFTDNMKCKTIYIPKPESKTELSLAENISYILSQNGAKLQFYNNTKAVQFGDTYFCPIFHNVLGDEQSYFTENVFSLGKDGKIYTYLSEGITEHNMKIARTTIFLSDVLIIGEHGTSYSKGYVFRLSVPNLKRLIFGCDVSVGEDALNYYEEKGVPATFTDTPISIIR